MPNIYTYTVPLFIKMLGGLKNVLAKAQDYAKEKGLNEIAFVNDALAPDMFPLKKQVQTACDNAKGAAARLSGAEAPKFDDTEETFAELIARVDKTLAYLGTVSEASFAGAHERQVTLPYFPGKFMTGEDYALNYALPNFLFHTTVAYALVRKNGVPVGKADYINGLPLQDL